jgi:hypothetical protein
VPYIEGYDDRSFAGNGRGKYVPVFLVVRQMGDQWLIPSNPGIAEVRLEFLLKICREPGRPSQPAFQCTNCFRDYFRRPSRLVERRLLGKPQKAIAKREVGEDTSIKNDQRGGVHS